MFYVIIISNPVILWQNSHNYVLACYLAEGQNSCGRILTLHQTTKRQIGPNSKGL